MDSRLVWKVGEEKIGNWSPTTQFNTDSIKIGHLEVDWTRVVLLYIFFLCSFSSPHPLPPSLCSYCFPTTFQPSWESCHHLFSCICILSAMKFGYKVCAMKYGYLVMPTSSYPSCFLSSSPIYAVQCIDKAIYCSLPMEIASSALWAIASPFSILSSTIFFPFVAHPTPPLTFELSLKL